MRLKPPLRDAQLEPVRGYCPLCGGEVYSEGPLCPWCEDAVNMREDEE